MKGKNTLRSILLVSLLMVFSHKTVAQCFQIESILVDACGGQEGLNEMVRFKVGNAPINTSNLSVTWPNNPWQGLVQNATTAASVATLNGDILDAGGCGQLVEPTGGVLPANATVILVTSFNFDTALNSFGALTDTYYILFQNNPSTASGHFANSGTGIRTLSMAFGSCSDTVSYDRALLIDTNGATVPADGATVLFNPAGTATYINNGCVAPVPPFTVDAGPAGITACAGATISLTGTAQGQQSVAWTTVSGTFSNPNALNTNFTVPTTGGNITLTLTATNSCGATVTDQIVVNVGNSIIPNFATNLSLCTGATAPILSTTSPNGITGSWSPSSISNTASGNYIFTPNPNQCASSVTLQVTVSSSIIPDFATTLSLCTGATAPILNTTSANGITGIWNPSVISNTASGNYIFTPNAGQCAASVTLEVTVQVLKFELVRYCQGGNYYLEVIPDAQMASTATYRWEDSNGGFLANQTILNVTDLVDAETLYPMIFVLHAAALDACETTTNVTVYSTMCTIPKGISPNGDGKNDFFDLAGMGVTQLRIFNRYGTEVYTQSNYSNEWNGQSDSGAALPDATYYYAIELTGGETKTGWVYLNR